MQWTSFTSVWRRIPSHKPSSMINDQSVQSLYILVHSTRSEKE